MALNASFLAPLARGAIVTRSAPDLVAGSVQLRGERPRFQPFASGMECKLCCVTEAFVSGVFERRMKNSSRTIDGSKTTDTHALDELISS